METLTALGRGFASAVTLPHLAWALAGTTLGTAVGVSVGAYLLFARVLQLPLPAGVLAGWM